MGPKEMTNGMPALALMQVGWGGGGEWDWKEEEDANGFPFLTAALYPGCYRPPCPPLPPGPQVGSGRAWPLLRLLRPPP